jgi:hypothetical protein
MPSPIILKILIGDQDMPTEGMEIHFSPEFQKANKDQRLRLLEEMENHLIKASNKARNAENSAAIDSFLRDICGPIRRYVEANHIPRFQTEVRKDAYVGVKEILERWF